MKIAVLGYSGSGKSTLARELGQIYQLPVLHLDTVQFLPGWEIRDREEAREMVGHFLKENETGWIIDGNYSKFYQQERLEQADQILFLNFNRFNCLFRALKRYFKYRNQTRFSMAEGCNEKFDLEFFRWIIWDSRTPKRRAQQRAALLPYQHKLRILRNQRELTHFIYSLKNERR